MVEKIKSIHSQIPDQKVADSICRIIQAGLASVDPRVLLPDVVKKKNGTLFIKGVKYDLRNYERCFLISFGKSGALMAQTILTLLPGEFHGGIIVDSQPPEEYFRKPLEGFRVYQADHPIPGEGSQKSGKEVLEFLSMSTYQDLILFLISGGGSALLTSLRQGIALEDLQIITRLLLKSGASIEEINTIRKHIDRIKGGGLAKAASRAKKISLILSDVIGDPLDMIASGPTVADPTTFHDAKTILRRYELWDLIPSSIQTVIQKGLNEEIPETVKEDASCLVNSEVFVIGNNFLAAQASLSQARQEGFSAEILTTYLKGEAFEVGGVLASILKQVAQTGQPFSRPVVLIAGGETTVVVRGAGKGGRNLEVALGAVKELDEAERVALISLATDGRDGPTDAAGAIVTESTFNKACEKNLSVKEFQIQNDSYHFFIQTGGLIKIGPTGTNVNDLNFLVAY